MRGTPLNKVVERWHSPRTQREMTLARWGHYGIPVLAFPTAGGDAEEVERHHLLAHLGDLVDGGAIKLYSVDSTAGRALATHEGTPEHRLWLFNQYHEAIASEVVPAIHADSGPNEIIVTGSSIGAFNALASLCRFPHLFRAAICMSGTYRMEKFVHGYSDDLYFSSPLHFLPGLEGPALDLLRRRMVVLATGAGRWEDPGASWEVANVLGQKGIPNRVDNWGPDYEHDWPTWWQMLPTYLRQLL
jgi:esterase/lipase superfamily enzyme